MLILLLNEQASAAFENIQLMAAPAGMGGAYSAATQDTSALIGNPAGLARLPNSEIGVSYLDLYGLIGYSFVGAAHPIRASQTVGAAILNSSDTHGLSHERIVLLSAATCIWEKLNVGMNAKYFSTSVNLEQTPLGHGNGWGVDAGIQLRFINQRISLGAVFPNLFSNLSYHRLESATYNEALSREWRIGTAVRVNMPTGKSDTLLAAVDIASGIPLIGAEYQYKTRHAKFAIRLGWRFRHGLTAGFGYQRGNIGLDYALVNDGYGSQNTLFSVRFSD